MPYFEISIIENITNNQYKNFRPSNLVFNNNKYFNKNNADSYLSDQNHPHTITKNNELNKISIFFNFREDITEDKLKKFLEDNRPNILKKLEDFGILGKVKIDLYYPYFPEYTNKCMLVNLKFKKLKYIEPEIIPIGTNQNISNRIKEVYKEKNVRYLNMALQNIGIERCLIFFGNFLRNFDDKLPIISIGSGTAYFEFLINRIFGRDIVCVDPNPISYTPNITVNNYISKKRPTVFIAPQFNNVNDLLSQNKNNKNYKDCLLLLNWPNPMSKASWKNSEYDPYDFNAIVKLKPIGFFIVYESDHISGSNELITALEHNNKTYCHFNVSNEETISYKLLEKIEQRAQIQNRGGNMNIRIAYYKRIKVRNTSTLFNNSNFFGNN